MELQILLKIVPMVNSKDYKTFCYSLTKELNDLYPDYEYPIVNSKKINFLDALRHKWGLIRLNAVDQLLKNNSDPKLLEQFANIIANDDTFSLLKNDLKQRFQNLKEGNHAGTSFENERITDFLKNYQHFIFKKN